MNINPFKKLSTFNPSTIGHNPESDLNQFQNLDKIHVEGCLESNQQDEKPLANLWIP